MANILIIPVIPAFLYLRTFINTHNIHMTDICVVFKRHTLYLCLRCLRSRRSRSWSREGAILPLHSELQLPHRLQSSHSPGPARPNRSGSFRLHTPPLQPPTVSIPFPGHLPPDPSLPSLKPSTHPDLPAQAQASSSVYGGQD